MVSPSPRASHSTSSPTIVAMSDNRNSQPPSIWHKRTTVFLPSLAMPRDHIAEALTLERLAEAVA